MATSGVAAGYQPRVSSVTSTASSSATYTEQTAGTQSSSSSSVSGGSSEQNFANRVLVVRSLTDDGVGKFIGEMGTVDYTGRMLNFRAVSFDRSTTAYKSDHENATAFERSLAVSSSSGSSSGTDTGGNTSGSSGSSGSGTTTGSGGSSSSKGGEYSTASVGEEMLGGSSIVVRYRVGAPAPRAKSSTFTPPAVTLDLCPYTSHRVVAGSVQFRWMGQVYQDFDGVLVRGRTDTDPGIVSGTMNYEAGLAIMTDYVVGGAGPTDFQLQSLFTTPGQWTTASIFMRTQAAPLKPAGVVLNLADSQGNSITAMGDVDGTISGTHLRGKIDYQFGLLELQFGDYVLDADLTPEQKQEWWYSADDVGAVQPGKIWRPWPVDPTTLRYNSVSYFYLPLDADIIGLDPVRLPPDGRVPMYRVGSYVVIGHTGVVPATTYTAGATIDCGRARLSRVYLVGADGQLIHNGYTVDLDAGIVTVTDVTGWQQPVTVKHRIEQMARVADVQIDGTLKITKQLAHDFPVGSVVSSAIMAGNLRARALPVFDQATWDGVTWADITVGNAATATYNDGAFPIVVTNAGAVTEKFALRVLTGGTDVEVIGQNVGNLGTFSRNTAIAPVNPISGKPYFTLAAAGWGSGWAAGNVLFVHTVGTYYPLAVIRATQPSEAIGTDYAFELTERGDVDRAPTNPVI